MKLWEKLLKREPSQETLIYNPVELRVGSAISIDQIDITKLLFVVNGIVEWSVGDNRFVDYCALAKPIDGDDVKIVLRVSPNPNDTSTGFKCLLLRPYHEESYSKSLHDIVRNASGEFVVNEGCEDEEKFWRVGGVHASHRASIKALADPNNDGRVSEAEVMRSSSEFWDYSRLTPVDGVQMEEFFFVSMNSNGWFNILRGFEVDPDRITI